RRRIAGGARGECCFRRGAAPDLHPLSLHAALPILRLATSGVAQAMCSTAGSENPSYSDGTTEISEVAISSPSSSSEIPCTNRTRDRKSTRLNSSHVNISYAAFCLKKKKDEEQGAVY